MPNLKKWAPILGAIVLVGSNVAELTGQADIAAGLRGVGGATGVTEQAPFAPGDVTAFLTAVVGVWTVGRGLLRKLTAEWQKAKASTAAAAPPPPPAPTDATLDQEE